MRKSPDGTREVVEMQVPIEGSRGRTVRITGLGLPPKVGIGAFDLPDSTWLEILNRDIVGHLRYDTVDTVRGGMMPLSETPLQGTDQTFAVRSGATFGTGTKEVPAEGIGEVVAAGADGGKPTMAWFVSDAQGRYLLVAPAGLDSFQLTELMARSMHGEFTVEMLTSGTMTARDEIAASGWRVIVEPGRPHAENVPQMN